jgi:hypothetical protein
MTIVNAFRDGARRVTAAPTVLAGVFVLTFVFTVPLGQMLSQMIATHVGDSRVAETLVRGFDLDWWYEFNAQASGVGRTFSPSVIGFAAVLDNLSTLLDNHPLATVIAAAATTYVLLWMFLAGGILDRYARQRATRSAGFFAACGVFFFRFLRLAIMAGAVYYALFAWIHPWLFASFYGWATHDMTVERSAFFLNLALYALFGALLLACNLVFDYAKIRAVVEDLRSMIGALFGAVRFIRHNAAAACGLYLTNGLLFVLVLLLYALVAPGANVSGWTMWVGFLVGQLYVLARLWVKLLFYASQTALFQGRLAHAEYAAAPQPVWPESPAAEAIKNASRG